MNNRTADWTECLAESQMPKDEMTFTDGLNGLLQGYDFEQTYGEGVEDQARLPESQGLSQLPGEFVRNAEMGLPENELTEDDSGFYLEAMLSEDEGALPMTEREKSAASMADLVWLDPTQKQNPERLPRDLVPNDVDSPIEPEQANAVWVKPDLAEAWGIDRRTDGVHLVPNKDREVAEYEESVQKGPKSGLPQPITRTAKIRDAIVQAVRRSHYGHSIEDIKQGLVDLLGHDARYTRKAMQIIEAEHGLAGTVFVRASAFPGLKNGKWAKELKKVARLAQYVITDDDVVASKLGKTPVASVQDIPWDEALAHYSPRLRAGDYFLKGDSPRNILKKAFLAGPQQKNPDPTPKPVVKPVVASDDQVRQAIAAVIAQPKVKSAEQQAANAKRRKALVQIARYVKAGRLSQDDAIRLHDSGVSSYQMMKAAADLMLLSNDTPIYDGVGAHLPKNAQLKRKHVWATLEEQQAELEKGLQDKLKKNLHEAVRAGLLTQKEASVILAKDKTAREKLEIAKVAIQLAQEKRIHVVDVPKVEQYKGATLTAAPQQSPARQKLPAEIREARKISKASGIKIGEFLGLVRWARQKMTEGAAGTELDQLLRTRFSSNLLKAAKPLLKKARDEHEGLSGFVYVDASAYASQNGSSGCKKHAAKHRANSVKFVHEMERCAGCVYANANGVCQQYNKSLASGFSGSDWKDYQKQAIKMADAPDQEVTASLFDPGEFGLRNGELEDIQIEDYAPPEALDEVLFGGMEIE